MTSSDAHFCFSDMPTVLRLVYSRFAAQDALSKKLESEAEVEALQPEDREHLQEVPNTSTDAQADQLIKKPAIDV